MLKSKEEARILWERAKEKLVQKHESHDQSTHGSWADGGGGGGGAGVDITESLDEVFFKKKLVINNSSLTQNTPAIPINAAIESTGINDSTQKIIQEMKDKQESGGQAYGDNALGIIAKLQGFDGKPSTVETIADLKALQTKEGGRLVYRGITNYSEKAKQSKTSASAERQMAPISYSAEQAITDFREGPYRAGWGVFGNGTYVTESEGEALSYSNMFEPENGYMGRGRVMAMLIPKSVLAKMPTKEVVKSVVRNLAYGGKPHHRNDVGRALASMGYQAYEAGYLQSDKTGNLVVLDRSMLTVAKESRKSS
jgi:hypothetical protein